MHKGDFKIQSKINGLVTLFIYLFLGNYFAYGMCLTKNKQIDYECNCQKNKTCMKIYNKEVKKSAQDASKHMSVKQVKKLYKNVVPSMKMADKMFANQVDFEKVDPKKALESIRKLEKINNKLIKKAEKVYKKLGAKNYKMKDRQKIISKIHESGHTKEQLEYIKKNGFSFNRIKEKLFGEMKGYKQSIVPVSKSQKNKENVGSPSLAVKTKEEPLEYSGNSEEVKARQKAANDAQKVVRNQKYKFNDIHPSHISLFKALSARYVRVSGSLSQKGYEEVETREIKQGALKKLFELIDIL